MNIFDPLITGSLSVSGSGEISGDLTVLGTINATISGTTSNAISASEAPKYTLTSSFEEFTSSIVSKTGSYATTGSNLFKGTQTHSGSILPSVDNTYDLGSVEYQWRDVYISSGSLYIDGTKVLSSTAQELTITTDNGQSLKILEGTTDSIVLQVADGDIELKSSADGDILLDPTNGKIMLKGPVEIFNGNKIQSSVNGTPVVFANDIVVSGSIVLTGTIDGIDLSSLSSSLNTRIGSIETTTTSLNSFTSSANGRLSSLESETSSLSSSIGSVSSSITNTTNNLSSSIGVFSSSFTSTITNLSSSMITLSSSFTDTDISHNNRLNTIESRYTTTGSNVFIGNQTITGSLYVSQNLIVQGESSLENVTASAVSIGTNTVILNADTPSVRYAGIAVYDSGSTNVTASLLYDSLTNQWKFKHLDTGTNDASVLLYGPLGDDIDNTPTLTSNFLTKVEDNDHGHHLTTSSVFDNGSKISLKNNTEVTGSLIVTGTLVSQGTTIISGSSQVSFNTISDKPSGIISGSSQVVSSLPNGTVSGSSQVSFNTISDKPTLISGSSQVSFSTISDKPTLVSGSSQVSFTGLSNIPGGLVSGSSQIDLTTTTNYSTGIKTRLNAEGVISGSSQVTGIANSQLTNSSFHVGTTSISLGRASASQTLTGVSIDGNAATVTNGVYTTGNQTIVGIKTFTDDIRLFKNHLNGNTSTWTSNIIFTDEVDRLGARIVGERTAWDGAPMGLGFDTGGVGTVTRRMTITSGGNVGINNNNPVFRLDVKGVGIFGSGGGEYVTIGNFNDTFTNRFSIITTNNHGSHTFSSNLFINSNNELIVNNTHGAMSGAAIVLGGNGYASGTNTIAFFSKAPGSASAGTSYAPSTAEMVIRVGNVGIGTINPIARQHNVITSNGTGLLLNNSGGGGGAFIDLDFTTYSTTQSGYANAGATIRVIDDGNFSGHITFRTKGGSIGASQTEVLRINSNGNIHPGANGTQNLGSSSLRWNTVFTSDLSLSNGIGDYTIVEGENDLFLYNNKQNKVYKFMLQEVNAEDATPKRSE
jgi:hypothetical protein